MKLIENHWTSNNSQWKSLKIQWQTMKIIVNPMKQWTLNENHENQWKSLDNSGNPWKPVAINEHQWWESAAWAEPLNLLLMIYMFIMFSTLLTYCLLMLRISKLNAHSTYVLAMSTYVCLCLLIVNELFYILVFAWTYGLRNCSLILFMVVHIALSYDLCERLQKEEEE